MKAELVKIAQSYSPLESICHHTPMVAVPFTQVQPVDTLKVKKTEMNIVTVLILEQNIKYISC